MQHGWRLVDRLEPAGERGMVAAKNRLASEAGAHMFALGGKVRGGVYGDFPATVEDGPEGDLTVMTDYRRVVSEILEVRGGATNPTAIFPTYTPQAPLGLTVS